MIYNPFKFELTRSYQALGILLQDGPSDLFRILSLLYLADREFLIQTNRTITGDIYSFTSNYLVTPKTIGCIVMNKKNKFFKINEDLTNVIMKKNPGNWDLCKANTEILKNIKKQFSVFNNEVFCCYMRTLPEIKNLKEQNFSAIRIMESLNFSEERIEDMLWEEIQHKRTSKFFEQNGVLAKNGKA